MGPDHSRVYPGTCRNGLPPGRAARAVRVRVHDSVITLHDAVQGDLRQDLGSEVGDFVLRRADGLFAYQLAVVVDDAEQGITHVVRGADLLDSTPRQVYLQGLLDYPVPRYLHLPVAVNIRQEKLGKQTRAPALDAHDRSVILCEALAFLQQPLPESAGDASPQELLHWASEHWDRTALPARRLITAPPQFQHEKPPPE